jgi:hypothetical protein
MIFELGLEQWHKRLLSRRWKPSAALDMVKY